MNEESTVENQEIKTDRFAEKQMAFNRTLELAHDWCSPQGLEMVRQSSGVMRGFDQPSRKGRGVKKTKFLKASQGYVAPRRGMMWDDNKKMEVKRK